MHSKRNIKIHQEWEREGLLCIKKKKSNILSKGSKRLPLVDESKMPSKIKDKKKNNSKKKPQKPR